MNPARPKLGSFHFHILCVPRFALPGVLSRVALHSHCNDLLCFAYAEKLSSVTAAAAVVAKQRQRGIPAANRNARKATYKQSKLQAPQRRHAHYKQRKINEKRSKARPKQHSLEAMPEATRKPGKQTASNTNYKHK